MTWFTEFIGLDEPEHDEYGLQKPPESWLETFIGGITPEKDDPWYTQMGLGFAAIPAAFAGHVLDNMPIIGGPAMGPLNEIFHGNHVTEYKRQRRAMQAPSGGEVALPAPLLEEDMCYEDYGTCYEDGLCY